MSKIAFRLENRRKSVERTLEHLRQQQDEVDRNTEWKDLCAQRRRSELLAELLGWYDGKLRRIDSALNRVNHRRLAGTKKPARRDQLSRS
jgi:RNA polymerase-binding transcription factor DksA